MVALKRQKCVPGWVWKRTLGSTLCRVWRWWTPCSFPLRRRRSTWPKFHTMCDSHSSFVWTIFWPHSSIKL